MILNIRTLTPDDFQQAAQIHVQVRQSAYATFFPSDSLLEMNWQADVTEFKEWWREWTYPPFGYIAEVNQKMVGFVMAGRIDDDPTSNDEPHGFDCEIYKLFILDEWQKRGIGTRLLKAALEELIQQAGERVCIWSYSEGAAPDYYRHLGGEVVLQTYHQINGRNIPVLVFGWNVHDFLEQISKP